MQQQSSVARLHPQNVVLQEFNNKKRSFLKERRELIDLSMINPDLPPARILIDKLVESAVRPQLHRYAVARGITRLRSAFAQKYQSAFMSDISPESQVCVTFGSKDAILYLLMLLAAQGVPKKALLGAPMYPAHCAALALAGFSASSFEVHDDEEQMLDSIRRAMDEDAIGVLLVNFPHNPTGITVSAEFWKTLKNLCAENAVFLLNDFVYGELVFDRNTAASALCEGVDGVVEVYSLSKAYSIPGWRIGAAVGDSSLIAELSRMKADVDYGTFLPLQHAAAEALVADESGTSEACRRYAQRAAILSSGLQRLQWQVQAPKAGCSVWAQLPNNCTFSGESFSTLLLEKEGVAVLPGAAFGEQYDRSLRFALVQDEERLRSVLEAVDRLLHVA